MNWHLSSEDKAQKEGLRAAKLVALASAIAIAGIVLLYWRLTH